MEYCNIVQPLDNAIDDYINRRAKVKTKYNVVNDKIVVAQKDAYTNEMVQEKDAFDAYAIDIQREMDAFCQSLRHEQPLLTKLDKSSTTLRTFFPQCLALGKLRLEYANFNNKVPMCIKFPIEKPLYVDNDKDISLTHRLMLRLLFAMPLGKVNFHVYDPEGLGEATEDFAPLYKEKDIFPKQKVLTTSDEFKNLLEEIRLETENMLQNVFQTEKNWLDYNSARFEDGEFGKMLPYRVIFVYGFNTNLDAECFNILSNLARKGAKCGIQLVYTFDRLEFENATKQESYNRTLTRMNQFIQDSLSLKELPELLIKSFGLKRIKAFAEFEKLPDSTSMWDVLQDYIEAYNDNKQAMVEFKDFVDINDASSHYDRSSLKGVEIPIGINCKTGEKVDLCIGDQKVHAVIGGRTGMGKSNLIHNIIANVSWHYSTKEINLYLLDFKQGVEFMAYAAKGLPQAKLVATAVDHEYAATLLEHLVKEQDKRYRLFNKTGGEQSNYIQYRKSGQDIPRIIVIIDEFQHLFDPDLSSQEIVDRNVASFKKFSKEGRAAGVHFILATQTLSQLSSFDPSQFGVRIALKCDADDSIRILGGTRANDAAAHIPDYHAIYNDEGGNINANIEIAIPEAKKADYMAVTDYLHKHEKNENMSLKIFDGQELPKLPDRKEFKANGSTRVRLGTRLTYEGEPFVVSLGRSNIDNLVICGGGDEKYRDINEGIFQSVLRSAQGNAKFKEIIYVGERYDFEDINNGQELVCFEQVSEFVDYIDGDFEGKNRFIIIDNCDLAHDYDLGWTDFGDDDDGSKWSVFKKYLRSKKQYGSVVAIYGNHNSLKKSGLPYKDSFDHKVFYGIKADAIMSITDDSDIRSKWELKDRAVYLNSTGEGPQFFRPYVDIDEE